MFTVRRDNFISYTALLFSWSFGTPKSDENKKEEVTKSDVCIDIKNSYA